MIVQHVPRTFVMRKTKHLQGEQYADTDSLGQKQPGRQRTE